MNGFVLVVVAVLMFLAGFLLGRQLTAKSSASRQASAGRLPDRTALAEAWQLGFDAASRAAVGPSAEPRQEQAVGSAASADKPRPHAVGANSFTAPGPSEPGTASVRPPERQAPPPYVPPVPVDPRVRALRNINITLYVAALLMVASASLFIALALPAQAKVVGLGIVAAGFYVAGLVMHARSERLRPAAAAFTATGLALIPMTGLAHYLLLSATPGASWFVTSVVGAAAFVYAAGRLQSKIIAGLATTFLVSTAYSGGAVLNRGLIYYFLFSMLLATAIMLVGFLRPRWIDNIYVQSFTIAHRFLVPATLLAAVLSAPVLEARDYAWIFAAAAIYYAVALFAAPAAERFWHLAGSRAAGMLSIGAFLHVAEVSMTNIFRVVALLLLAQAVVLAYGAGQYSRKLRVPARLVALEAWVLLSAAALCTVLGAEALLRNSSGAGGLDLNWALALLVVAGFLVGAKMGGAFRWVPLGAAVLVLVEPMVGNQGRQGIVVAAAVLATWVLARNATGRGQLLLRWAARLASVVGVGALFSFAAAGWILQGENAGRPGLEVGSASGNAAALLRSIEVASLVGIALALLFQAGYAIIQLRKGGPADVSTPADGLAGARALGESAIFAGAVVFAGVCLWSLAVYMGWGSSLVYADVDTATVGWSTLLWLGLQWDVIVMWLLLGVGLMGATLALGYHRAGPRISGEAGGEKPAAGPAGGHASGGATGPAALIHLGGLVTLAAALGIGSGMNPRWLVELVAVIGLAYVGIRVLAGTGAYVRAGYAVLAQVLFSATAWHVADRFEVDGHGQYALFAFTIALAQSARAILSRRAVSVKPGDPRTLMGMAALALLLLVPAAYLADRFGDIDQASLLIQCLCLLVFAAVLVKTQAARVGAFRYAAIAGALGFLGLVLTPALGGDLRSGGWLPDPLWGENVATTMLVFLLIGILVAEVRALGGAGYRWVRAAVALMYWVALTGLQGSSEPGWQLVAGLLGAAGATIFAATWGVPLLLLGTAALVLLASLRGIEFVHDLAGAPGSEPLDTMTGLGSTFVILLIMALFGGRFEGEPASLAAVAKRGTGWGPAHARVLFSSALAALGLGGLLGQVDDLDRYVFAGGAMLLVAVIAAAALEVPARHRETGYEVAALMGAAVVHRCWWVGVDGTSTFAAFYYWVVTLGLLAAYEFSRQRERNATFVLGTSAALLSLAGLGTIVSSDLAQQLVVLLTFTALLVFGLLTNRKIFTVWGAVGVAVAVLWFLRGFTFLLLLLIAAGLIALALWKLGRMNKGTQDSGGRGQGYNAPNPPPGIPGWWTEPRQGAPSAPPIPGPDPGPDAREVPGPVAPQPGNGMPWMKPRGQEPTDDPR